MRGLVIAALLGLACVVWPAASMAQPQPPATGTTQSLGAQSVTVPSLRTSPPVAPPPGSNTAAPVPSTRVLGVPVTADAPVSPSYDGTAYKTLGGQAETDQDAISGQVMQPLDSARPK